MRVNFLFWNINQKPLYDRIIRLISAFEIHILMLAESPFDPGRLLAEIDANSDRGFDYPDSESDRIQVYTSFPTGTIVEAFNDNYSGLTIRRLKIIPAYEILLAVAHFRSKKRLKEEEQLLAASRAYDEIHRTEDNVFHQRSILVGDLNMNPFEPGVTSAQALHAVMAKSIARRKERVVMGKQYRFFYNPMWGLFGDRTEGPPGSYYFSSGNHHTYFWNMFDQVLLRPELMESLRDLRILDHDGHQTLLTKGGIPRGASKSASDHLPIFFTMEF
ncbi:hypothetical protein BH23PLA1_BH23PLA1_05780 [soil metagenome]